MAHLFDNYYGKSQSTPCTTPFCVIRVENPTFIQMTASRDITFRVWINFLLFYDFTQDLLLMQCGETFTL